MKIALVDDGQLACKAMQRMLMKIPNIEIVGEADNLKQAVALIQATEPDVVLLDISLPGGDGFELLSQLETVPLIIVATAHDQYALRAFEVNAVDYLLKPIESHRLVAAINRAQSVLDERNKGNPLNERLYLQEDGRCWFIRVGDIERLESIGNYSRIYFGDHKPMIKRSLKQLHPLLPSDVFMRANRHQIINLDTITSVSAEDTHYIQLLLNTNTHITLSRRQSHYFKERWSLSGSGSNPI